MEAQQRLRRWLRAEHGSQGLEAAGAALAAALLVLALLLGARGMLGPSVERAFECAAAVIGGGGADCGGGAASTPGTPANTSQAPPAEEKKDCNFLCKLGGAGKQVLGVGKGIGEGVVDLAKGVWTLGSDAFKAATGDQATRDKYAGLVNAFKENPWETTKAIAGAMVEPIVTDWKEGRYGEAIGRGIFEGASVVFGPKGLDKVGKLGKLDDIARVAGKGDEIADTARTISRLPCVGAAPAGKGPGLAKPLEDPCSQLGRDLMDQAASARQRLAPLDPKLAAGGRNVAAAKVEINGRAVEDWIAVSANNDLPGTVPTPKGQRVFETFNSPTWMTRDFDTEVKILEEFAQRTGAKPGQVYPDIQGRVDLFTERTPCPSCTGVIKQFEDMYPNVEVNVYYTNKRTQQVEIWQKPW